jgi:type IV pilus assembly protein PilY1
MRRSTFGIALLALVATIALAPHSSSSQVAPDDVAARTLLATNYADAVMHGAKGEDTDFFIRAGGVPNIFFLVDTSGSMERLPPDGPATYGGRNPTLPPGALVTDPSSGLQQTAAFTSAARMVGCGLDPVSNASPGFSSSQAIQHIQSRRFYPPCGKAHNPALVGAPYAGHAGLVVGGADYAFEASICPYYTPSNSQAVWPDNQGGYDPDYYNPAPNASAIPSTLWADDLVYHDSALLVSAYGRNTAAFRHNFGKGWDSGQDPPAAYPYRTATGYATIDQFCADQGTTALPNGQVPSDVCRQCLRTTGWYYDGVILEDDWDGTGGEGPKRYPSIWYTGNYLNFFPPKFVIMRKIVKDIIATQSKIRMAVAKFGTNGMTLLKEFNPTCAMPNSSFDSNRSTYVNVMNDLQFEGGTPLAYSLFDVGRYYHSPANSWFGNAWEKTGNSWESSSNSNDYAICYSCQTSSVIILTDGQPSPGDGTTLPNKAASIADSNSGKYAGNTNTGILLPKQADCPECFDPDFGATSGKEHFNNLARAAFYLHNYDLRLDTEATKDCKKNGGKQVLDVYTVGYATGQLSDANKVLANAARAGGGIFVPAEDPSALKAGILSVFEEINGRSTSFSVATVSTLQTTTGHSVIVPRFDPSKSASWKGHLYRYELYSEFVNECPALDPSASPACCEPGGPGDLDCDGACVSAFLMDADEKFIQEGGDGFFYENENNNVSCNQAPVCEAGGGPCDDPGNKAASPWWDAADRLREETWKARKVFTVVDSNGDARIDADDATLELGTTNDDAARKILPYLGNRDDRVCNIVGNRIETAGDAATAHVVRTQELECAKTVIRWLLGADVFNEAGRKPTDTPAWPPPRPDMTKPASPGDPDTVPPIAPNLPDQEQLPDRPFKLGDVFHSSPVEVVAPLPRQGILCRLGLHNQCLQSLWRAPSGEESSDDDEEYDDYVGQYAGRRKLVLVGANDGLVHAFNGGAWHADEDDPVTPGVDESQDPFNGYYDRGFDPSSASTSLRAQEIWAFLPPDMIAKLPLVIGGEHHLFVDGTPMVRDVWVDGSANGGNASTAPDDVKQAREFHTVAVFGQRRGGTHYFALDITDATRVPADAGTFRYPKFLWMYPQPTDKASLSMGETYTDFLPNPPPIGPVRIKADANSGSPSADTPSIAGTRFHERWIAFLSGGFDPNYVRGRGVMMVDVWTGKPYWEFTYPESSGLIAADDPRMHLRYPVPATVGMTMWGPGSRRENGIGYANNGFFDTATFGDAGGQVWTLRFHAPGELDANGKVTNWFGARAFQMGGQVTPTLGYAYPFFYLTANTALPDGYIYRAYIGSGDRFNLLDFGGGVCAPDNIRACAMRGCTVNVELAGNYATTPELGKRSGSQSEVAKGNLTTSSSTAIGAAGVIETRAKVIVSACPSPDPNNSPNGFTKDITVSCGRDPEGRWGCTPVVAGTGNVLTLSNTSNAVTTRNWYFSMRIFDDAPQPRVPFATLAEAKTYDANRLWIRDVNGVISQGPYPGGQFTIIRATDDNPPAPAGDPKTSAGWAIYFDHEPTIVADGHNYNVRAVDERTSSVSALYGFVSWNTTQPATGEVTATNANCFASKCTAEDRSRVAYHYAAHPLTGGTVLKDSSGNSIRAHVGNTLVPSQGDQATVFVNRAGRVRVGLTVVNPEKGAGTTAVTGALDAVTELGWIEVPESVHACRHAETIPDPAVCR